MDSVYVWLFLFAGATIAFLGMLLLTSERELRKKRRELQEILRNHTDNTLHPSTEPQDSETHSSAHNQELLEKISFLSSRLEESQRAVDELQAEQRRLVSAESDNQQRDETIVNLRAQLQMRENRLSESAGQAQEIADRNAQLQTELGELVRQHQASQTTIAELQAGHEGILLDAQSEKQKLCVDNQQLQQEIADLRNQLQTRETLLGTNASQYTELTGRHTQLQFDVTELKQQLDHLMMKNKDLSEEKNSLSSKLVAAQKTIEELQTIQEGSQSENQHLQAANQELQRELAKLNLELQTSESRLGEAARQVQDSADRNAKLQREAAELKEQLQSSQKTIEELRVEQERLAGVHFENQKLRQEAVDLRDQLQTNETRLGDLSRQNQEAADHYARLKGEAADLTRQLEEMQPKIRELDVLQQELASVESREMILKSRQNDQETQIAALQRELSVAEGKVQELDRARKRLAEMERLYEELRNEKHRLEEEISRWRERLDRSEEDQRQIDALRQPLSDSQMKDAQLRDLKDEESRLSPSDSDLTHILQSTTHAGGELARKPIESAAANPVEPIPSGMALSQAKSPINGSGETRDNHTPLRPDDSEAGMAVKDKPVTAFTVQIPRRKKSRMATISAVVVLAIAAGGAVGFLGIRYFASEDAAVTREFVSDERSTPIEAAPPTAETKPALRLQGKFKITRATEVYSGPTEKSALITRIEPGMKVNVVDSRGGWLEIRSKYGRPPGFVREDAAVKIDQN